MIIRFTAVALILGTLTSCSSLGGIGKKSSPSAQLNELTGTAGSNGEILAVKVDDTAPAHPQIGLASADVVYIEQVEGGLTRLAAIFSTPEKLPELIGPVRSARISDIEILSQYGHVAFAFSGAQSKLFPVINAANLENLGAEREPSTVYSRDHTRNAPTNLILHPQVLLDKAKSEGKTVATAKFNGWKFGKLPVGGKVINSVSIKWPASHYSATWSASQNDGCCHILAPPMWMQMACSLDRQLSSSKRSQLHLLNTTTKQAESRHSVTLLDRALRIFCVTVKQFLCIGIELPLTFRLRGHLRMAPLPILLPDKYGLL